MIHDKKPTSQKVVSNRQLGTGNAVSELNKEGKWRTVKVKTHRYISGKVPDFASNNSNNFSENDYETSAIIAENELEKNLNSEFASSKITIPEKFENIANVNNFSKNSKKDMRPQDKPITAEKIIVSDGKNRSEQVKALLEKQNKSLDQKKEYVDQSSSQYDNLSEDDTDDSSSRYDDTDYTDSDDEKIRLKPVYVRKQDRLTLEEKNLAEIQAIESSKLLKKAAKDNKFRILNLIDKEMNLEADTDSVDDINLILLQAPSGCDEKELEFDSWKIRELERMKRDKKELELMRIEKEETINIHEMNNEKRLEYILKNPKIITNSADKGKYDYLQKYYHRGVFYLGKEDDLAKRNVDIGTEEDNFDRTKLPKIMQVRDFGKIGRTKYTHLVDQDTNEYLNPLKDNNLTRQMHFKHSGGMKQNFERPSSKRKK